MLLVSVLFIIGALLTNVNSIKDKIISKQSAQDANYSESDVQNNDYADYESQNQETSSTAETISQESSQSNWFKEYDKASQDIIKKYSAPKNFLTNAVDTKGQIVKWGKRELKIYIEEGQHKAAVLKGVNEFKNTFGDIFTLIETNDKNLSDIEVTFEARPTVNADSLELGQTVPQYDTNGIIQKSYMKLYTIHPITKQSITDSEMYSPFLHEMGHAVGVVGHSQKQDDLVYASSTRNSYSQNDIATIKAIYSTDKISDEDKKQIANDKITEAENYAQKYPKEAIAWINLAQAYYAQNKYEKAANAYNEAMKISPTDANIYIGLASCYYSSKKYGQAIETLQYAQTLKLDEYQKNRIIELFSYNYIAKGEIDNAYFYTRETLDTNPYNKVNLGNFLIICAKTGRKLEAKTYLTNYLQAKPEDRNDPALKDFADAFNL